MKNLSFDNHYLDISKFDSIANLNSITFNKKSRSKINQKLFDKDFIKEGKLIYYCNLNYIYI